MVSKHLFLASDGAGAGAARKSAGAGGQKSINAADCYWLSATGKYIKFAFNDNISFDFLDKALNQWQAEATEPCRSRCEERLEGALRCLRAPT